ncbi:hypothetical protein D6D15_08092, partial [Aureobasidium pullulans]
SVPLRDCPESIVNSPSFPETQLKPTRSRALIYSEMLRGVNRLATRPNCLSHTNLPALRRSYASVTDLSNYPKPGDQLHGFTLKRAKHVPELELTALQFTHERTGADYLHIARDDQNNVFSIGFKTNPPDATGVPHILEHTTLCGSQKFPVRDPFFKMLPRSLSNFMNAFTSSDHTTYPFATTNAQDFKNLMGVYLDATLHPLLQEHDFTQEGWRLGPENPQAENPSSDDIIFKGVVYNEMKGQMSDSQYLYYIRFHENLFPAINNSGGDPQKMTDLTYEQLKKFHADHYHPSNAKVLTYGNLPLTEHLQSIGKELDSFSRISVDSDIKVPESLDNGPRSVTVKGPLDPLSPADSQYKTSVTWLMGDTSNVLENFSLSIISSLLMDGYGSPLYRNLIEAGLGPDFSPNTGFDGSGKRGVFSVGLNGVKQENVPKVKEAVSETLRQVREKGFDQSKIDGILHQLELSLKHKTANFGMSIIQRLKPGWFNGVDVFDALAWQQTVDTFKAECAKGGYLEGLLEKYLLNDNTLTFTMEPSATYGEDLLAEEAQRLASKKVEAEQLFGSKQEAYDQLKKRELELVEQQMQEQDLSCLPSVHVKDIPRSKPITETRQDSLDNVKVQWREAPTNGLTYFRALSIFKNLPTELRTFVPLFCDALMRIGTKTKSMEEIEDLIKLKTGGVSFGYHACTSPTNTSACEEGLSLSGFALDQNVPALYDLIRTIILETDFDGPKAKASLRELIQSAAGGGADTIAESGHAYARRVAEAGISPHGNLLEQTGGISQIKHMVNLASLSEIGDDIIQPLKTIQQLVAANVSNMRVAITCGAESTSINEAALQGFLSSTFSSSESSSQSQSSQALTRNAKSFFPLPYQVYYSGLALPTVPYTDAAGAPLAVLAQLLTHKHLHREIRERGGAYGGGAYSRALDGVFGFYSYRDPNPENTIKVLDKVGKWAVDRKWTDRDLEDAKLSVFQALDAPRSVSEEGMTRFVSGVTPDMEQTRRQQLLDVSKEQVRDAAERFLVNGMSSSSMAVLGARKSFVDEAQGWKVQEIGLGGAAEAEAEAEISPLCIVCMIMMTTKISRRRMDEHDPNGEMKLSRVRSGRCDASPSDAGSQPSHNLLVIDTQLQHIALRHGALKFGRCAVAASITLQRTPSSYKPLRSFHLAKGEQKHYQQQYADMYFARLAVLKPAVERVASKAWDGFEIGGDEVHKVDRVLDVRQGELVWVAGTVYMEMPLKPNILDDISKHHWIAAPPPRLKFTSGESDQIMLEDESGRLRLTGSFLSSCLLVTGCIVAVMGTENANGDFEVIDLKIPELAPQPERWSQGQSDGASKKKGTKKEKAGKIAIVSTLGVSGDSGDTMALDLLVEYLLGESTSPDEQEKISSISRLLVAGNSLSSANPIPSAEDLPAKKPSAVKKYGYDASAYNPAPTDRLDSLLESLLPSIPITLIPGEQDPTHTSLPQQPMHSALFPRSRAYMAAPNSEDTAWFDTVTNPWEGDVDGWRILATGGQPIDDVFKYVEGDDRLEMMEATLRWRLCAPTAPDTLWCYPFQDKDRFVIEATPHVYIVGNQPRFESTIVEGPDGQSCRIISVPRFKDTGELLLLDAETLEVEVVKFGVYQET